MRVAAISLEELQQRLAEIEGDLDGGRYKAGPWQVLIDDLRSCPSAQRIAVADRVSRVSRKLHQRQARKTIGVGSAIVLEIAATIVGGILLIGAASTASNVLALAGAAIWATTFQPLIKVAAGRILGVRYDYAYLYGWEPRFKMNFGSFLAAERPARVLLHLAGTIGSPLAAGICGGILPASLGLAKSVCWIAMWAMIALNLVLFAIGYAGIRRLGGWRTADSSGGSAALELRGRIAAPLAVQRGK